MYRADVKNSTNEDKRFCLGVIEIPFRKRLGKHTGDFRLSEYRNRTELSKYIWKHKENNIPPVVEWNMLQICYQKSN